LGHQKQNFQYKLIPAKEESLEDLCAQERLRYLCSSTAKSSQHSSRHRAGLRSKYFTSQTKTLPPISVARQKGVNRAHPLEPICHHKDVNVPEVNAAQLGRCPDMEEAPNRRSSSKSKGKPPAGRSQLAAVPYPWLAEPELSAFHLHRRQQDYILKLEAEGLSLKEEIRKKEALLFEKLMRTIEVLSRIEREKELGKEKNRDREAQRTHEQKAAKHPEKKTPRVAVGPGEEAFGGPQSSEAPVPKPGTTLHPQELSMVKLKEERLVASNSKTREQMPVESSASCSKLAPKRSPPPSALSDRESSDLPSTQVLYVQAGSAVEQEEIGQCSFCGRKFLLGRLEKHESICGKSQGSKRKAFDSSKARAMGTDLEQYQQWKRPENPQNKTPMKNNWKEKQELLIQNLRQAHQVQQLISKGAKASDLPPLPPVENPDYVPCPYCRRQFAPQVAERHIPKCKTIRSRPPPPPQRQL
ncbi:ZC21C protein, partial [Urocolius indicus]|nr:ZC21C protein [Urocolius indicus]